MKSNVNGVIQTVAQLEAMLSEPSDAVVEMMRRVSGDIIFLGVGGKIGPSLAWMAQRASDVAGTSRRIIGVSRFSSGREEAGLQAHGVETIRCDLLDEAALAKLPDAPNVIYLPALKFGSQDRAADMWAINTWLPSVVCRKFRRSRIVAYSTGAVYGMSNATGRGCSEVDDPEPVGEYAMSCLGRERMFEYFSRTEGAEVALIRLFYASELRYGVLVDIAHKVHAGEPIDLAMGHFNMIWQGDNNATTLLALEHAASPPFLLNVTGPQTLSIREVAEAMGRRLGRPPKFCGEEMETACLGNAEKAHRLFGPPRVSVEQMMDWVAAWVQCGGEHSGKPTHFERRDGKY